MESVKDSMQLQGIDVVGWLLVPTARDVLMALLGTGRVCLGIESTGSVRRKGGCARGSKPLVSPRMRRSLLGEGSRQPS